MNETKLLFTNRLQIQDIGFNFNIECYNTTKKIPVMKTWFPCVHILIDKWYFASKIVREIFLKFETEGRKFAKLLRSLEQSIQTVKGLRTIFGNNMLFLTCSWRFVPNRLGQQKVHACPSVPCNIFYILSMWTEREVHSQMSTLFHPWVHVIFSTFCPCVKIRSIYVIVEWPLMVFARMGFFFSLFARTKKVSDYSKRSLYPQFHQITGQSQYE